MTIPAKIFRVLFFFLIFVQVAAMYYRNDLPAESHAVDIITPYNTAEDTLLDFSSAEPAIKGILYSPEKLLLPDALLSPIPSFQFGFIELLACFLFVIFSFYACTQIRKKPFLFTNSYFHTLFLSVILINAP
jgi:hypothetical protein